MPTKNLFNKIIRHKGSMVLSIGLFVSFLGTSQAEDIEIFTNAFTSNGEGIVGNPDFEPNVLLIVDNSTSMGRTGPVPDESRQQVPLSEVILDDSVTIGLADRPQVQTDSDGFCDDNHSGATGDVNTKNRFFYYPDPDVASGTFSVSFCETRFDTLQRSLRNVLGSAADGRDPDDVFEGFSVGLMRMNRNRGNQNNENGGTIVSAVAPIGEDNIRQNLRTTIDELDFGQSTPVTETLYEGYLYFSGEPVDNGFTSNTNPGGNQAEGQINWLDGSNQGRAAYQTDAAALDGSDYESPIVTECQANTIVFLSDGAPTNDDSNDSDIEELIESGCSGGTCSDDIAEYMNGAGNISFTRDGETINSQVNTVTIGLNIDSQVLRDIGAAGTGLSVAAVNTISPPIVDPAGGPNLEFNAINPSVDFYTVSEPNQLEGVFEDIFSNIGGDAPAIFAAPAVSVDSFNRLSNRNDIYFALFQPVPNTRWPGNVKRYSVSVDPADLNANEVAVILDENDNRALTDEGFFADTAVSAWTDPAAPDGNVVEAGAAAANLITPRRLFGEVDGNTEFLGGTTVANFLSVVGAAAGSPLSLGEIGADDPALEQNRADIASFTLNIDALDEDGNAISNGYLGDNLHGDPYVLTFAGSDPSNFEDVIFYTSNQGLLHAIDGDDGSEMWAYIPDESLFQNLGVYYNSLEEAKEYGLDSEIAFSVVRNAATQEVTEAILYFGQRRGGNKVFAVDVSDARDATGTPFNSLWTVDASSEVALASLGQTWAQPVVTRVNVCDNSGGCPQLEVNADLTEAQLDNVAPEVLFVAGGYDEQYDIQFDELGNPIEVASLAGNVQGNALYMLNAATGAVEWMASDQILGGVPGLVIPEMVHSVVARPTVLDTDFNGVADTIFFADVSGQVFRIDFRTSATDTEDVGDVDASVSGGLIANLREPNADRLFFNSLNVAILPPSEGDPAVAEDDVPLRYVIATGSGYRAHPLDPEVDGNFMHVIYDENIGLPLLGADGDPSYEYYCTGSQEDDPGCGGATPRVYDATDFGTLTITGIDTLIGAVTTSDVNTNVAIDSSSLALDLLPQQVGYRVPTTFGGEKIISPALINNFALSYSTYIPSAANASNFADNCEAELGTGVFFSFDLETGQLFAEVLDSPGIPTQPAVLELLDPAGNLVSVTAVGREIIQDPDFDRGTVDPSDPDDGNPNDLGKANRSVWWETGRAE